MGYKGSKKNFRRYVVNPLKKGKLITLDKRGFINVRNDIEARATKVFDEDQYQRVIAEVEKEREDYKQRGLSPPLGELLRSRKAGGSTDVTD